MDKQELDTKTQEYFNNVLNKDINDLNEEEIGFLKARRVYLTEEELNKYSFLFKEEVKEEKKSKK